MSATLHFPDVGPHAQSGDDIRPGSIDIGWAERAFANHDKADRGHLRSARHRTPRQSRRRLVLVVCALVLIFVGLVVSAASLSPATAPVPSAHTITTGRSAAPASTPRSIQLGPLPLFERGDPTAFILTPTTVPLLVQPDRAGPSSRR